MAQNTYDHPALCVGDKLFPRSRGGPAATSEWTGFRAMLPALARSRVFGPGCGFAPLNRRSVGAEAVVGIDLSGRKLALAAAHLECRDSQSTPPIFLPSSAHEPEVRGH
jgi:hypothetical protein